MGVYEKARLETKKKITEAFWDYYRKEPINRITIQKIADTCGIHRSTFYIHFQDVYQILEEIEKTLLEQIQILDTSEADTSSGLHVIGESLFNEYRRNRKYLRVLVKEQRDYPFALRYRQCMQQLMVNIAQLPGITDSRLNKHLMQITASIIIETFLQCADDDTFSFADTEKILYWYMQYGFLKTLDEGFSVAGLRIPKNN